MLFANAVLTFFTTDADKSRLTFAREAVDAIHARAAVSARVGRTLVYIYVKEIWLSTITPDYF